MSRPKLSLVKRPSLALVKKALRLYSGRGISREQRHRNARMWLLAMTKLGDKHTLHISKPPARWGFPGIPGVRQIRSPRRLGEQV